MFKLIRRNVETDKIEVVQSGLSYQSAIALLKAKNKAAPNHWLYWVVPDTGNIPGTRNDI